MTLLLVSIGLAGPGCADDAGEASGGVPPFPSGGGRTDGGSPLGGRDATLHDATRARDAAGIGDMTPPDPSTFNCPEMPTAWVFDFVDPHTQQASVGPQLLAGAGFAVQPLPLDRDPRELKGLIFFSSFASESPEYRAYASKHATSLQAFVEGGNVLLQMTQADQTEPVPPFLPATVLARRHDLDLAKAVALDRDNPLLQGVPLEADGTLTWQFPALGWETFASQSGFEVLLGSDAEGRNPVLMEAAHGQGRYLLSAIPADKPVGLGPERDRFNGALFKNLHRYVGDVCRRQVHAVKVTASPSRPGLDPGSFMLAVLPDTQYYSAGYPGIFLAQTSWIATNVARHRIPYVLHLGDITDDNSALQWQRAAEAMFLLEEIVPYALATGNHDFGPFGHPSTRDTLLNDYFSYAQTARWPSFGGSYQVGRLENTYHFFEGGGRKYIILALEWGPRDEVVAWANGVMSANADRLGILITHAYMNNNDRRYDHKDTAYPQDYNPHIYMTAGGVNDGEELWQKLVRKHRFVMTLNGHVLGDGTGYLASVTDPGTTCHQMLSNYQFRNLGGEGFMRLLEFLPDATTVRVHTYSPLYDQFLTERDQSFTLKLDPLSP